MNCLDHDLRLELEKYVEELTTTGKQSLDEATMKKLKKICKTSDIYVEHVYHLLMSQMNKEHSEIRLSALMIVDELFCRSHAFRELFVSDFQKFLELTVESDYDQPLPPPIRAAKELKIQTLKTVQKWYEKYGEVYKKLALGYNFLKTCKRVDFNDIRARSAVERHREEEQAKRKEAVLREQMFKAVKEMEESHHDMRNCLTEIENGFALIVPSPNDFFIKQQDTETAKLSDQKSLSKSNLERQSNIIFHEGDTKNHDKLSPAVDSLNSEKNSRSDVICDGNNDTASDESDNDVEDQLIHTHGLGSRTYNLSIEIPVESSGVLIEENEDNADILKMLKDQYLLMTKTYLPSLQKWLRIFSKSGTSLVHIKKAIDIKSDLEALKKKFIDLNVVPADLSQNAENDSDDDDFEDVPEKEGYEPHIPAHLRAEYGLDGPNTTTSNTVRSRPNVKKTETCSSKSVCTVKETSPYWNISCHDSKDDVKDPTTVTANLAKMRSETTFMYPQPSTSTGAGKNTLSKDVSPRKNQLLKKAPVIPFGVDLAYWENPQDIKVPIVEKYDSLHKFWVPSQVENERASKDDIATLTCRTFEFAGEFEPVKWSCRAPLSNGKLCERMDRYKCPFHGKIIPRNVIGSPASKTDLQKIEKEREDKLESTPDWQDPELLRDIEGATGLNLEVKFKKKGKGKKGKASGKRKYPNLTDTREATNTSRTRLESKVFNRSSVKRVSAAMDEIAFKKVRDKFANQFNYAYKS